MKSALTIICDRFRSLNKRLFARRRFEQMIRNGVRRVVVGASGLSDAGWACSEAAFLDLTNHEHWSRYFSPGTLDIILAEHVWEHLSPEDARIAAGICYAYLRKGGLLRIAVPDGFHVNPKYIEAVRVGGTGPGSMDHKVLYDCTSLTNIFRSIGFEVNLLEYFDAAREFHCRNWDPDDGMIHRSIRFDPRNVAGEPVYTSLILDARKPI